MILRDKDQDGSHIHVSRFTFHASPILDSTRLEVIKAGLKAVSNPLDKEMMDAMITAELLLNKQIYSDSFLTAYRSSL